MLYIPAITSIQILRLTAIEVAASYIYILFHEILQNFLKNLTLSNSVDRIYPIENEIKDTTERDRFGSYLDLHLETTMRGG
jgi:antirestriction protein ArdC